MVKLIKTNCKNTDEEVCGSCFYKRSCKEHDTLIAKGWASSEERFSYFFFGCCGLLILGTVLHCFEII